MIRSRLVQALCGWFPVQEREDRVLARFGQLKAVRQTPERPRVPLFLARKSRLV